MYGFYLSRSRRASAHLDLVTPSGRVPGHIYSESNNKAVPLYYTTIVNNQHNVGLWGPREKFATDAIFYHIIRHKVYIFCVALTCM